MKTRTPLPALLLLCLLQATASADDWPQWRGPKRDGVWRETGLIDKFDAPDVKRRWTAEIAAGYSGPTVADGRVYLTDRITKPEQIERVLCFDWTDGREIWTHSYPCKYVKLGYTDGPRASVTVDDGRAYALGAMGHLVCLDAVSGKVLWKKDPQADFNVKLQTWGIAAAPLVEGDLLILQIGGTDGACIVALDKATGRRRWAALDDPASYSAPICIDQAGCRVLVCRTGTRVVGLDARSGQPYWDHTVGFENWPIAVPSPVVHADRLLISCVDKGSLMLKLRADKPAVEKIWWRFGPDEFHTDSLQPLMSTPLLTDKHIYGVSLYGILRGLQADSGDRLWEDVSVTTQARFGHLHMVPNGDRVWIFNDCGELIIGRLSPKGFDEISRAKLIDPTLGQLRRRDGVTWSHPAFAYKHVFIRNDEELVCASLAAEDE